MKSLIVIALLGFYSTAQADFLQLNRKSILYSEPNARATKVVELPSGTNLLLEAISASSVSFYPARTAEGLSGWVPRTHVRRFPGVLPSDGTDASAAPWVDIGDSLTPQQKLYARRHYSIGKPQATIQRIHEGYALAHDSRLKIPVWVQYELSREELHGPAERKDNFRPDMTIPSGSRAELSDYGMSGFDRGHMAPAEDLSRSESTMTESFLLSNMAPQVGVGFNQHLWKDLEAAIRGWVNQRGRLTIITGPVFKPQLSDDGKRVSYRTLGDNNIAVPTHFFKIVVDASNPMKVDALAFLVENTRHTGRKLEDFTVSIDEIEQLTGLDFLSGLPSAIQASMEARRAETLW